MESILKDIAKIHADFEIDNKPDIMELNFI